MRTSPENCKEVHSQKCVYIWQLWIALGCARFPEFTQNFSERQILWSLCSVDFHTLTLQLPIQTPHSVAPELQVFVSSHKISAKRAHPWTPSFCEFTWKLPKFKENEHTPEVFPCHINGFLWKTPDAMISLEFIIYRSYAQLKKLSEVSVGESFQISFCVRKRNRALSSWKLVQWSRCLSCKKCFRFKSQSHKGSSVLEEN